MKKSVKYAITFCSTFIVSYLLVGFLHSNVFSKIHWRAEATIWDKLREYYIRTFRYNLLPTLIVTVIFTAIIIISMKPSDKDKS